MLKRLLLVSTIIAIACTSVAGQSNETGTVDNVIKINPISIFVRTASVFYERKIGENKSIQLGLFYTNFTISDVTYKGFGITPEYRYYFSGEGAPSGWFLGPFIRYQRLTIENDYYDSFTNTTYQDEYTLDSFGGGVLIGKQWVFKSGVSVEFFAGPNYLGGTAKAKSTNSGTSTVDVNSAFEGIGLRAGVTVGYGF
jgi:hypothetical protein